MGQKEESDYQASAIVAILYGGIYLIVDTNQLKSATAHTITSTLYRYNCYFIICFVIS